MTIEGNGDIVLATGGYDHTVKIWNAKTGVNQRTFQHQGSQVNSLAMMSDKQVIAAAGYQQISMYEIHSKNQCPVTIFENVTKNVTSLGFHKDGKWMYSGGEDMCARIWDLRSRTLQCQRIFQVSSAVNCVRLHPNQTELLVGDQSGVIHLWDLNTDHNEQLIPEADASIQDIDIDEAGSYMAAVNNKGKCYIWSLTSPPEQTTRLNPKHKIEAHPGHYALSCRFSPDSTRLVTTSADSTARVWRTTDFSLEQEMKVENQRWVWGAAFTVDSQYLVTGKWFNKSRAGAAFTVDSQYLVTASSDGMARLWDVATGTVKREYSGHQKALTALAFEDQQI